MFPVRVLDSNLWRGSGDDTSVGGHSLSRPVVNSLRLGRHMEGARRLWHIRAVAAMKLRLGLRPWRQASVIL